MDTAAWAPRGLAVLRIMTALLFLEHATVKFLGFPTSMGDGPLPPLIIAAGVIEVVTSLMIIAGFYTRAAAFIASGQMAVAYFMAHAPQSFWPLLNGGESAILFCFVFLYIAVAGPGAWAVDTSRRVVV
ncbi:DoxX family protein [Pleomorphomonas diazotrophica]|uniref:DoxX family protein n=1 Tax=Pleomorphomonas diazotrophica TaxID=1166257 RepID=A0A1I4W892_9HYPH|nr:DoxX family protein [Pleomorphomonas diazotrophica]PKR87938.1 DoxX family protein [Pleomorphomonas diazotrophica]SFN09607.1 putative oxidoreductase [Pleomorphomonas diazotrophica]